MSTLQITPVASRRDKKEFLRFPWTVYRGDENWIPPLRVDQKELVNFKPHPFYLRNEVQTFLARRSGEVVGRIAAILNRGHVETHDDPRGFFGFFECADDQEAAAGLFEAARDGLAQRGMTAMRGPANPSLNYTVGLLVEGFGAPPYFMMTYNRPYYERLIEGCGFHKAQDLYAYWGRRDMLPAIRDKLEPIKQQIIERLNLNVRILNKARFAEEVEDFLTVYNRSMAATWGFVPMSPEEIRHMAGGLRWLIVPELSVCVEVDGEMIGAVFGLLDYNPRIREIDGRLFPLGFLRLLRNKRQLQKIRLISTNVIPEYQRYGVGLVLMGGLVPQALEWGMQEVEFSWVLESNLLSRGSLEKGGAVRTKTYRVYDLDF